MQARSKLILAIRLIALVGALLLLLPVQAAAADVRAGGNDQVVGAGTTINDDLYVFGTNVTVAATVDGTVIAAGSMVTINGHVTHDVMVAGGNVTINGPVDGSVRVAGGTVNLNGSVGQDAVVMGGTLNVSSPSAIGRDVMAAGGVTTIAAPVTRNVMLSSGTVTIQDKVGGNVTGTVDQLKLTEGARISGNLDYTSSQTVVMDPGTTVAGAVTRHTPTGVTPQFGVPRLTPWSLIGWLQTWVGFSILGLLLLWLFPKLSGTSVDMLTRRPGASIGLGTVILVVTPFIGLTAFIAGLFVGGWWLALLLLPAYFLALAVGYVVSGLFLGRWTARRFGWTLHPAAIMVGGLFLLTLIGAIPWIGWLIAFAAVLFGLGALALAVTSRPPAGLAAQPIAA